LGWWAGAGFVGWGGGLGAANGGFRVVAGATSGGLDPVLGGDGLAVTRMGSEAEVAKVVAL